jgi:hypothetical protein
MRYIAALSLGLALLCAYKAFQSQAEAFEAYRAYDNVRNESEAFKRTIGHAIDNAYVCKGRVGK